ncbi:MAG: hypothetical protein M1831_003427 [Alyxoria varia]|nr:MAG: hypothetical protein M1831_003427 [Alyxoria varia]
MSQQQASHPSTAPTTTSHQNQRHSSRPFTVNCFCPCSSLSNSFKAFTHYHFPNFTWARSRHTLHNDHTPHAQPQQPSHLRSLTSKVSSFHLPLPVPRFPWSTASARSARSTNAGSPVRSNTPGETLQLRKRTQEHRERKRTTHEQKLCRREQALGSRKRHHSTPNLRGSGCDAEPGEEEVEEAEEHETGGEKIMSWQQRREEEYEAPSGPPPGRMIPHNQTQQEEYEAPPGPPPPGRSQAQRHSYSNEEEAYEPPPGPPPSRPPVEERLSANGTLSSNNPYAGHLDSAGSGGRPVEHHNQNVIQQDQSYAYHPQPPPPQIQEPTPTPTPFSPTQQQPQPSAHQPAQPPPPAYSTSENPHPWQSIPLPENANADLPPPPSFPGTTTHKKSPTSNASYDAATTAHTWCELNPLHPARSFTPAEREAIQAGSVGLAAPPGKDIFKGSVQATRGSKAENSFDVQTKRGCGDACLVSKLPVYSALDTAARVARRSSADPASSAPIATAYFTLTIRSLPYPSGNPSEEAGVSLGFLAPPYPPWRQPGWERASLAVHGDDGRRYVNDTLGGSDFTAPFKIGETIGLGMRFYLRSTSTSTSASTALDSAPHSLPAYQDAAHAHAPAPATPSSANANAATTTITPREYNVRPFLTRHRGSLAAGPEQSWDLDEEVDAEVEQPGGVVGLRGDRDLYAAVGVFGGAVGVRVGFVGLRVSEGDVYGGVGAVPGEGGGGGGGGVGLNGGVGGSAGGGGRVVGGSGEEKKKKKKGGQTTAADDEEAVGNGEGSSGSGSRWSAKLPWRRRKE